MRHLTLIFASLLAISSTGCVTPYGCGMGCGLGNPYGACVADCNQYGGLPSPAEYRRQRRFYRDLNRLQRKYPNLAACVGIGGCSACDVTCGGPVIDSCCGPTMSSCTSSYGMPVSPSCSAPMMSTPTYNTAPMPSPVPAPTPAPMGSSHYMAPPLPSFPSQGAQMTYPPQVSSYPQFTSPVVGTPPVVTNSPVVTSSQIISSTPSYSRGPALPAPSGIQQAGWTTGQPF